MKDKRSKNREVIPVKTVERLCTYRLILFRWLLNGKERFFSHELAEETNITSAQVRRDLMSLETIGTPANGYVTSNIIEELGLLLEGESGQKIILVGLGNLGRAILKYFNNRRPNLNIVAAFDNDTQKHGLAFSGLQCKPMSEMEATIKEYSVTVGVLTVSGDAAQKVAAAMVDAGIMAIVNFTPVKLKVKKGIYVEDLDIATSLEKAAYFARVNLLNQMKANEECFDNITEKEKDMKKDIKRILCIDDDKDVIESYKMILLKSGYEVDIAYDGETGLAKAREKKPDLIILDVMMTDQTEGFQVAYKIRADEKLKYTPILMLTSVSSKSGFKFDKDKDGEFLPVDAFVDKPVAPNSLLSSIKQLLTLPKDKINVDKV